MSIELHPLDPVRISGPKRPAVPTRDYQLAHTCQRCRRRFDDRRVYGFVCYDPLCGQTIRPTEDSWW